MKVLPISAQTSGFKPLFRCQPIRPLFRGYKNFDGKNIKTSDFRMWKGDIFVKDVVESANATFKKLTLIDSRTNKPIAQKVREVVKGKRISFKGYPSILKTMWRQGLIPSVKKGLYGDELTQETVSVEHLIPKCKGGRTELANTALASRRLNNLRNAKPIGKFLTKQMLDDYCKQWEGIQVGKFNGHRYIDLIKQTLKDIVNA